MEVILLIGLQGAGKSTYAQGFAGTHTILSKDAFRNHRRPQRRLMHLLHEALVAGNSVVLDNTHPTPADRAEAIALARQHGATVRAVFFDLPFELCWVRNQARTGKAQVPPVGLYTVAKTLQPPRPEEGFDTIEVVHAPATPPSAPKPRRPADGWPSFANCLG